MCIYICVYIYMYMFICMYKSSFMARKEIYWMLAAPASAEPQGSACSSLLKKCCIEVRLDWDKANSFHDDGPWKWGFTKQIGVFLGKAYNANIVFGCNSRRHQF